MGSYKVICVEYLYKMRSLNILLLILLGIQSVSGQDAFTFFMESTYLEYPEIDLSQDDIPFEFNKGIKNNGDNCLNVGWKISSFENCPLEWELSVSDKYSNYTIRPNFEYSIAIDVDPNEYSPFNIMMYPNGVYGSCTLNVQFFDADNPSKIYDSAQYELRLNPGKNTTRSIKNEENNETFQIYPNPSFNVVNINTASTFESGRIYTSEGQLVMNINANQRKIQIEDLEAGVYRIVLDYSKKEKGTATFIKIK